MTGCIGPGEWIADAHRNTRRPGTALVGVVTIEDDRILLRTGYPFRRACDFAACAWSNMHDSRRGADATLGLFVAAVAVKGNRVRPRFARL